MFNQQGGHNLQAFTTQLLGFPNTTMGFTRILKEDKNQTKISPQII